MCKVSTQKVRMKPGHTPTSRQWGSCWAHPHLQTMCAPARVPFTATQPPFDFLALVHHQLHHPHIFWTVLASKLDSGPRGVLPMDTAMASVIVGVV